MADVIEISDSSVNVSGSRSQAVIHHITSCARYEEFFEKCLISNEPGIIAIESDWKVFQDWLSGNGSLNLDYLSDKYGSSLIAAAQCDKQVYNVQEKLTMTLSEYLKYWKQRCDVKDDCLYLKDWHFTRDYPKEKMYRVPKYFASDWLSEYFDNHLEFNDDYRFVYLGPTNSWTPLHCDVFTSFSWSVNVIGRKRWLLMKPGADQKFRDRFGNLLYRKSLDFDETDDVLEIIQEANEAIFIPSSWHHQVWNLEDTLSINHNWINGANISGMWTSMKHNLESVKQEITDCKDMDGWHEHCQIMLKALFGFNYPQFFSFLKEIGEARMRALHENRNLKLYGDWEEGSNHMRYDLRSLLNVLIQMQSDDELHEYINHSDSSIRELCNELERCLENVT